MDTPFRLRPMDLRDILDDTFDLYKENFTLFVTITGIIILPFNLLLAFLQSPQAEWGRDTPPAAMIAAGGMYFLTFVLGTLATYVAMGALTRAVSERYLGRRITPREAYRSILGQFGAFIVTLILPFIVVFLSSFVLLLVVGALVAGLMALNQIVGGIFAFFAVFASLVALVFFFFSISFVMPVFVIEGKAGWAAVRRSIQLYSFHSSKAFFTILLVWFIVVVVTSIVVGPFAALGAFGAEAGGVTQPLFLGIQGAVGGIAQAAFQPIQSIVILLLYYDIRIRREGFDLEMMANDLRSSLAYPPDVPEDTASSYPGEDPTPTPEP